MEVLYGLHPVAEAVRAGARTLERVIVARERRDSRLEQLIRQAREGGVQVSMEPREHLTRMARTDAHQGVVALTRARPVLALEDLLRRAESVADDAASGPPAAAAHRFFLALDGVEDPHNLGALLRSADAMGVEGVVLPERRSAPLSSTTAKSSAGAMEHLRIARVPNLVRALEQCKREGLWIIGLDERAPLVYTDFDFCTDCVLVLGREGAGLHDLTRRTCDHLLRIPMAGRVSSLNVSVAGAVVMFEAVRQRRPAVSGPSAPRERPAARKGLGV